MSDLSNTAGGGSGTAGGTSGQIQYNNGGMLGGFTVSGDGTLNTSTGVLTVTKTNGVAFGTLATLNAAPAGTLTGSVLASGVTSASISTLSTLTSNGLVKTSGGTGALSIATAGTDYQAPITLTTTGTSGASTFISNTLNIPQYAGGVTSVSNVDTTLTISPTTGAVVASLNLAKANTWSANGAASTSAVTLSGTPFAGTGTTSFPLLYLNNGSAPTSFSTGGTYLGINAASGFAGNVFDIHSNGGISVFTINASGHVVSNSLITGLTFNSTSNGAASTSPIQQTGTIFASGTGTTNFPQYLSQNSGATAVTTWSTAGTYIGVNTNTGFTGNFVDFRVNGGSTVFSVANTGALTLGTPLTVANGGIGVGTLTGIAKGNGTSAFTAASAGTDYQAPITLTTTGTSGASTFIANTLNIPQYAGTTYSAGTGLTLTTTTFSVNTSQNISTLSNLTTNGFVKTSGSTGALSIDTNTYVTAVSVASTNGFAGSSSGGSTPALTLSTSITGVLKGNGTAISAASAGTDYQAPITLTTTGTSGAATFTANTLNIPQYSGGGGSGTVNSGTATHAAYYATSTAAVSDQPNLTFTSTTSVNNTTPLFNLNGVTGIWFPSIDGNGTGATIAIGNSALSGIIAAGSTFYGNTVIGYHAAGNGVLTTAATGLTIMGYTAGAAITTATNSTLFGNRAGNSITTGTSNAAFGAGALSSITTDAQNVAVGNAALATQNTSGSGGNVSVGFNSGSAITTGGKNLILGYSVSSTTLTTGTGNILIGTHSGVDTAASGSTNSLNIGNLIYGTGLVTSGTTPGGKVGINVAAPVNTLSVNGSFGAKRVAVADTAYTILLTDYIIAYSSISAARIVSVAGTLGSSTTPQMFIIKDESGSASVTNTITLTPTSGTIDGAASKTIITLAYGVYRFYTNGTNCFSY